MFSENLKILRKQKGLTQEALAIKLHITRQTISKWEKGLSVPDAEQLVRLAEVLDSHTFRAHVFVRSHTLNLPVFFYYPSHEIFVVGNAHFVGNRFKRGHGVACGYAQPRKFEH